VSSRLQTGIAACLLLSSCAPSPEQMPTSEIELVELLPASSTLGAWVVAAGPLEFTADNLYERLNGGAERYIGHGFRRLVWIRYQHGDDNLASVEVELFDMGSKEGAFGIYGALRDPEVEVRSWGSEGFRRGTVAAAWQQVVFVHGVADDDRPDLTEKLESFVEQIVESAGGDRSPPEILSVLPQRDLVPRSERLVARDLLGHGFLPGGLTANYRIGDTTGTLFLCDLGTSRAAVAALEALQTHHRRNGHLTGVPRATTSEAFEFDDPVRGHGEVRRNGHWIAGVFGETQPEDRRRVLDQLAERLAGQLGRAVVGGVDPIGS